ncbi:hypothetical protein [Cognatishimia sp. F0-27]|uniref:hypothetical protein n=1 Tax=Cognatishimia sp. F0-27 TaxID=2816855 RepID=UPI001D0C228B|nr:hypothetical protein [Cognatishimia sp. F0-27]MCC1490995.1 hypothetical protein [Cognatishimia sp. F0-27]
MHPPRFPFGRPALLLLVLAPFAALAEPFALRDGDVALPDPAARFAGQSITFFDNGVSAFYEDGRYTYTYANDGGTAYGYWRISETGAVCIDYVNGFARCDLYVENAGRLILLDEKGDRYPVRP